MLTTLLQTTTEKIRELIDHAPAGGVFHNASFDETTEVLHAGFANERHTLTLYMPEGRILTITVEQLSQRAI